MRVFKDRHEFSRLPTYFLVMHVVVLVMPLAKAMPMQPQKADQEVQKQEQEDRLFKRSVSTISVDPDFHKIPETPQRHYLPEVPDVPDGPDTPETPDIPDVPTHNGQLIKLPTSLPPSDKQDPKANKQEPRSINAQEILKNSLLDTKLSIAAKIKNGANLVLSGTVALAKKIANAAQVASIQVIKPESTTDQLEPQATKQGPRDIEPEKTSNVSLPNRLLATKLALGAMLANGAEKLLSGKAALTNKLANAARAAWRTKITLATIIKSSRPNYHMAGSEEALNGNDETFLKWLEGDEMRQIWLNKQHKTLVSVLESAIATKIALGGILMGAIKNELQAKTSLAEKFAWAAKVASREKLIWALRVGSELGLKDDMPLPKYKTLSDDKKWKEYLEELEKFAEKHRIVGWNKIVLG